MDRALRRYRRELVRLRWVRRIKQRRGWRRSDPEARALAAVRRIKNHYDLRSHSRKSCSICNPIYRVQRRERVLRRDLKAELNDLVVKV